MPEPGGSGRGPPPQRDLGAVPEPIPPEGVVLEGERARIELENGCFERLNWRCTLRAPPAEAASIVPALVARGYSEVKRVPQVLEAFHPEGHRVAVVPSTGRIQIRVALKVEEARRGEVAMEIAEEVAAAIAVR